MILLFIGYAEYDSGVYHDDKFEYEPLDYMLNMLPLLVPFTMSKWKLTV